MGKHYVGEVGTEILLDTGIDITDITVARIYYQKPGKIAGTWEGVLLDSFSNIAKKIGTYYVSYTLAGTDMNVSGLWQLQAVVANTAGTWFGETAEMNVHATFE